MNLPFTQTQFFDVMAAYNRAVWPAQVLLVLAVVLAGWPVFRRTPAAGRWVSAVLALLWAWMGVAYHWAFFTGINPVAWFFGALSLAGAAAFAWHGVWKQRIRIDRGTGLRGSLGWALIAFALVVYPVLGHLVGHRFPAAPTFGLPCPTTIFTVGVLMIAADGTPRSVYVAPVVWSAIGASAAFVLGVYEDLGLAVAGVLAVGSLVLRRSPAGGGRLQPGH